jgi:hypothetical protein
LLLVLAAACGWGEFCSKRIAVLWEQGSHQSRLAIGDDRIVHHS